MTTPSLSPTLAAARAEFDALVQDIRPELHRYVARMIGSVVDGEDVVQEALAKAYYALPMLTAASNLRGWLFRIAHNKAIDHLRRYNHQPVEQLDATVPEIKAALHRGRTRLRELAQSVEVDAPVSLDEHERELLARYIDCFNARDFEAVRVMLADEVRLDLIGRAKMRGEAEVSHYFHNYQQKDDWRLAPGIVEGRPAILVYDPHEGSPQPAYFMLITWDEAQVSLIRDYRYARHVMRDAEIAAA